MKKQSNNLELLKKDGQEKWPYEKPQLGAVKLFADQVLGTCLVSIGSICDIANPCNSGAHT